MVRIRHAWLVVVLALAFVAACKKDDTAADKAGGKSGQVAYSTDLALLPLDSELVLGVNLGQVQQSALWKQLVEPKLMSGDVQKKVAEFKEKCGFDPMAAVKSISAGVKGVGGDKPDAVVVAHGIDKAKVLGCLDKMKDEIAKDGTEVSRDGDITLFKGKNGEQAAITFLNDSTLLAVLGDKANAAGVKAAAAGSSTLKTSASFNEMYSKINTNDSLWLLMNGNAKPLEKAAMLGVKAKALFGSVNVTDGLSLDLRMRVESPESATQFATMAKGQVQQAAKMFDKVDVSNDGADVKISVSLSNQKLQDLIKQVGGMFSAFGGGMGGP